MKQHFVLLRSVKSFVDANLVQGFLLSHNIEVKVDSSKSENAGGAYPFPFASAPHGIHILVERKDLEKAKAILKEAKL